jgi:hypothetical protein
MIASHGQPLAFEHSRDTPTPFTRPIAAELVAPPAEYAPPVQAVDALPLTTVVADGVREQGVRCCPRERAAATSHGGLIERSLNGIGAARSPALLDPAPSAVA